MLLLLLEKKKTTAPELARLFEISVRTVYRDIDRLSAAGIPVYTTTGKHGGIHLMDHYVMDKSLLSEDEQNEILLGLYSVSAIPHLKSARMLGRLTTLFDHKLDWIEFEYSPWGNIPEQEMELFNHVKQAIFASQLLSFHYVDSNGEASEETALPIKLIFKNNTWYFKGLKRNQHKQDTFITYKIKRITELRFVPGGYERMLTAPMKEENINAGRIAGENKSAEERSELIQLELLFEKSIAYRVYDLLDPALIQQESDGKLRISLQIDEGERLYSFLLSFGSKVTVLQPSAVRQELRRRHQDAVSHMLLLEDDGHKARQDDII
ncbi:YafY family transcriptional regulator [Paenibacillus barcinonensis]|uniref:Putative DNA-binding transcriptional regulator YafY n=2 Tax=Paenibacillus barcinonensis TaxID=198119 RepID=A0A2V4VSN1_PAEBA|nr:putative DNA-binding transcriptional regulator YafY [Paenibacillus barcinonensis]QKS60070.1 YafY family transcriptional regulator [Paenibacillus barcinonensis]